MDETSSLLRERDEEHASALHAPLSRALVRHRVAVAIAFAVACALGVARLARGDGADVGAHTALSRWKLANGAFPLGRGSCAFVSNDPHLRGQGPSIDAHDEVIRLNNWFQRVGGSADYGNKATYVVGNTAYPFLYDHGPRHGLIRAFARRHRCLLRYEPAFECGPKCNAHNTGEEEYTKHRLDTEFGCEYISKEAWTTSMRKLAEAQVADGPGGPENTALPSTGALAVFSLAPKCAEVHMYGFTKPKPPYYEAHAHDMEGEHEAFRAAFPNAVWH